MSTYVIRRLFLSLIVLWLVTVFVFFLIQLVPGDPAVIMLGESATKEQIIMLRQQLWLDRPLVVQYVHWASNALHGDFGQSIIYKTKVTDLIAARLPVTLYLSFIALVLAVASGISAGIISAVRRGGMIDYVVTISANVGMAMPMFWLGFLGIYFVGLKAHWLPIQGFVFPSENLVLSIRETIMPVICLAVPAIAVLARQTRSSMLEVIHQDYVRTAHAKGLQERVIIARHTLKNALIPVVTMVGLMTRVLVGGAVLIETVFNIPGMGRLIVDSVLAKDFVVVQACTLIMALVVLLANLAVDMSYGWLDPRIRY